MKNFDFKKQVLPHLLAVLVFLLLIVVYFAPVVFQGKNIKSHDAMTWTGNAASIYLHRDTFHEEPLWTNNSFGGMPAYTISVLYSGELLEYVEKAMNLGLPYPISIMFLSLVCSYVMLLAYGVKPWGAVAGALAITFFSFNFVSLEAGHNSKLRAMAFTPVLLAGVALAYKGNWKWGFLLAALGTAFQMRAGHYQITYYAAMIIGVMGLNELIWAIIEKRLKNFGIATAILLGAAFLGVATNAGRLMTLQEYTQYSMRGKPELSGKDNPDKGTADGGLERDYVFSWSFGKMEAMTVLIPGLYGGASQENVDKKSNVAKALSEHGADLSQFPRAPYYWGEQPFTSGPTYAGAAVIFLFVLGMFVLDNRHKWWLFALTIFSLCLTMGRSFPEFNNPMYDSFPGYNKFRTVTMAIIIAQITIPILAIMAIDKLFKSAWNAKLQNKVFMAAGLTAFVTLVFALIPSIAGEFTSDTDKRNGLPAWLLDAVVADRESIASSDSWRSFFFVILTAGVVFAGLKRWLSPTIATLVICGVILLDLWPIDRRYLSKDQFERVRPAEQFAPSAADNEILLDKSKGYRVLNLDGPFSESKTSSVHRSIGGYSPVKLRRYQDLIVGNVGIGQEIERIGQAFRAKQFSYDFLRTLPVLNMLNTKYIKANEEKDGVIQNPFAMGAAWFVPAVKEVQSPDEEYESLVSFDPKSVAILDIKKFKHSSQAYDTTGAKVVLTEIRQNLLTYDFTNPGKGMLVFSEVYYPEGWIVTVDGQEVPQEKLLRVNYVLRALETAPGTHKVVFSFKPKSFTQGNTISLISSLSLILMLAGIVVFEGYNISKAKNEDDVLAEKTTEIPSKPSGKR
ncbi:MAG: YfhO family protein [Bacteroidota bacterium]